MIDLSKDAEKNPLQNVLMILLLFIAMATLPTSQILKVFVKDGSLDFLGVYGIRIIFSLIFLFFIYSYGFKGVVFGKVSLKSLVLLLPLMVIAINNFPFYAVFVDKTVVYVAEKFPLQYLLVALFVAVAEEFAFRALILPLITIKFSQKDVKFKPFLVIVVASAIFSAVHLINLFSGTAVGVVVVQLGYSFLLGAGLCLLMIKTRNVILPILVHFIYNAGGALIEYGLAFGWAWTVGQIVLTAVVAVIMGIIVASMIFSLKNEDLDAFMQNKR